MDGHTSPQSWGLTRLALCAQRLRGAGKFVRTVMAIKAIKAITAAAARVPRLHWLALCK